MAQEEWLALNNGRLIGTNILPPQTESEIVAWIAERKKRFPAKATAAEREAQKQAEDQKRRAEDRVHWEKKREMRMEEVEEEEKKRVAREERRAKLRMGKEADEKRRQEKGEGVIGEESEDDGPPEEVKNSEARTVFRDDTKKNRTAQRTKKLCRDFARGNCRRGPMCPFKHEVKEKRSKQVGETGPRKSLYQRVCLELWWSNGGVNWKADYDGSLWKMIAIMRMSFWYRLSSISLRMEFLTIRQKKRKKTHQQRYREIYRNYIDNNVQTLRDLRESGNPRGWVRQTDDAESEQIDKDDDLVALSAVNAKIMGMAGLKAPRLV